MSIRLIDDGTLDTVLGCSKCDREFRFSFEHPDECTDETGSCDCREDFIDAMIHKTTLEHVGLFGRCLEEL